MTYQIWLVIHASWMTFLFFPFINWMVYSLEKAEAIKCHQCMECADATQLSEATECTKVTLVEATFALMEAITGQKLPEDARANTAKLDMGQNADPGSCFKVLMTANNKDYVMRGCSPAAPESTCQSIETGKTSCICLGDGCNSAPTVLIPSIVVVCISVFLSSIYA